MLARGTASGPHPGCSVTAAGIPVAGHTFREKPPSPATKPLQRMPVGASRYSQVLVYAATPLVVVAELTFRLRWRGRRRARRKGGRTAHDC